MRTALPNNKNDRNHHLGPSNSQNPEALKQLTRLLKHLSCDVCLHYPLVKKPESWVLKTIAFHYLNKHDTSENWMLTAQNLVEFLIQYVGPEASHSFTEIDSQRPLFRDSEDYNHHDLRSFTFCLHKHICTINSELN
jgi:hypothetical protein